MCYKAMTMIYKSDLKMVKTAMKLLVLHRMKKKLQLAYNLVF